MTDSGVRSLCRIVSPVVLILCNFYALLFAMALRNSDLHYNSEMLRIFFTNVHILNGAFRSM